MDKITESALDMIAYVVLSRLFFHELFTHKYECRRASVKYITETNLDASHMHDHIQCFINAHWYISSIQGEK